MSIYPSMLRLRPLARTFAQREVRRRERGEFKAPWMSNDGPCRKGETSLSLLTIIQSSKHGKSIFVVITI